MSSSGDSSLGPVPFASCGGVTGDQPPSQEDLLLWKKVADMLDKTTTVVWKNALDSLQLAYQHLKTSEEARHFVEAYMKTVINILLAQRPDKIGPLERGCVDISLESAVLIISDDIKIQQEQGGECKVLDVLANIFNSKKPYYKKSGYWTGCPEVRMKMIERFRQEHGFTRLADYLLSRRCSPSFPCLEQIHHILVALFDASNTSDTLQGTNANDTKKVAMQVSHAVLDYLVHANNEALTNLSQDALVTVRGDLQQLFDKVIDTDRETTYSFYSIWRNFCLRLISSEYCGLKLLGWKEIDDLIGASANHRPPPKEFVVSGAGIASFNGTYGFNGFITSQGYAKSGETPRYTCTIPDTSNVGGGIKTITLFRCTMRSQQKWWFLSEADKEQPGTDKDIDYYQHKSMQQEEKEPPPTGWVTCRNVGIDPPPTLKAQGLVVPAGEEYNTLEYQLFTWAIENDVLNLAFDASMSKELVPRAVPLCKFLATMCWRDRPEGNATTLQDPRATYLQDHLLLLTWKACIHKINSAVSDEIYRFLASILPSLPDDLATNLLDLVHGSLAEEKERLQCFHDATGFCLALELVADDAAFKTLSSGVRTKVLQLCLALLMHPGATSFNYFDRLKDYVVRMIRNGTDYRQVVWDCCIGVLLKNTQLPAGGEHNNEVLALHGVKLSGILLKAYSREEAVKFLCYDKGSFTLLLFDELLSFLRRKGHPVPLPQKRLSPGVKLNGIEKDALLERLRVLRHAFGLSKRFQLSRGQLTDLWELATIPRDREVVMSFIADRLIAQPIHTPAAHGIPAPPPAHPTPVIAAAFSDDTRNYAFRALFCSLSLCWNELGEDAYSSFRELFAKARKASSLPDSSALDALWRICFEAGNETVASRAISELLTLYVSMANMSYPSCTAGNNKMRNGPEIFCDRLFGVLTRVTTGLERGDPTYGQAAYRCLQILDAALGNRSDGPLLPQVPAPSAVGDGELLGASMHLPLGMRSQSCYQRVVVLVKRISSLTSQDMSISVSPSQVQQGKEAKAGSLSISITNGLTTPNKNHARGFFLDIHPLESLGSIREKVASSCKCPVAVVKLISAGGRLVSTAPDESTATELGITQGCDLCFVFTNNGQARPSPTSATHISASNKSSPLLRGDVFNADSWCKGLLALLESFPVSSTLFAKTQKIAWDLLLAIQPNVEIVNGVRSKVRIATTSASIVTDEDSMAIDTPQELWAELYDQKRFQHSVYFIQVVDSILQPALEVLCALPVRERKVLEEAMHGDAEYFRHGFVISGGVDAVVQYLAMHGGQFQGTASRIGNAGALRVLNCCLFGNRLVRRAEDHSSGGLDEVGKKVLRSLTDTKGLLKSLIAMVVGDDGISSSTIIDVLMFLRLLFHSRRRTAMKALISLPKSLAQQFFVKLLLLDSGCEAAGRASVLIGARIRKSTEDLILSTSGLATNSLAWFIDAMEDEVKVTSNNTSNYFTVVEKLIQDRGTRKSSPSHLKALGTAVCKKLASCYHLMNCNRPAILVTAKAPAIQKSVPRSSDPFEPTPLKELIEREEAYKGAITAPSSMQRPAAAPMSQPQCQGDMKSTVRDAATNRVASSGLQVPGLQQQQQLHPIDSNVSTSSTANTVRAGYVTPTQAHQRQEQEAKRRKEKFLMFTRVLMKYLEQKDPNMHARAKAVIRECAETNKNKEAGYESVTASMQTRLRATVGDAYWKRAESYLNHFLNQKKEKVEEAKRQQAKILAEKRDRDRAAAQQKIQQIEKEAAEAKRTKAQKAEEAKARKRTKAQEAKSAKKLAAQQQASDTLAKQQREIAARRAALGAATTAAKTPPQQQAEEAKARKRTKAQETKNAKKLAAQGQASDTLDKQQRDVLGVLCGCLKLLRVVVEKGGGAALVPGAIVLLQTLQMKTWLEENMSSNQALLESTPLSFPSNISADDQALIDLSRAIFFGFLSPIDSTSAAPLCCSTEARQLGLDVVVAAAKSSTGYNGYFSERGSRAPATAETIDLTDDSEAPIGTTCQQKRSSCGDESFDSCGPPPRKVPRTQDNSKNAKMEPITVFNHSFVPLPLDAFVEPTSEDWSSLLSTLREDEWSSGGALGKTDPNERLNQSEITGPMLLNGKMQLSSESDGKPESQVSVPTPSKIIQEAYDLWLACELQDQLDKESKEHEEKSMHDSITGRAYKFVEQVLALSKEVHKEFTDVLGLEKKTSPVATDDMVYTAERMMKMQQEFSKAGKPVHVDIGYHYTKTVNLCRIRTNGLMSYAERQQHNIVSKYNGSQYGDGIYTANNHLAYHGRHYGEIGLLVARLRGSALPSGAAQNSFSSGNDCVVAMEGSAAEIVVLRTASQCVPLVQYAADLVNKIDLTDRGNDVILRLGGKLQNLIDVFFNSGTQSPGMLQSPPSTTPTSGICRAPAGPTVSPTADSRTIVGTLKYEAPATLSSFGVETAVLDLEDSASAIECPICFDEMNSSKAVSVITCGHEFHLSCIRDALSHSPNCPICRKVVLEPRGKMPSGSMKVTYVPTLTCSGCGPGTIMIQYSIQSGTQKQYHDNPGKWHGGAERTAYLPNNDNGRKLLRRLYYAFQHGLTFTVGTSLTTGRPNSVTWSSIHHKTSVSGGPHGFPDPNFFKNCNEELDALNVLSADDLVST